MSRQLPFFKFFPIDWITGDITLCGSEEQAMFINVCALYWQRDCQLSKESAVKRYDEKVLQNLIDSKLIKTEGDSLIIEFLDEQMNEFINLSKKRSEAGKKGGKRKNTSSKDKAYYCTLFNQKILPSVRSGKGGKIGDKEIDKIISKLDLRRMKETETDSKMWQFVNEVEKLELTTEAI